MQLDRTEKIRALLDSPLQGERDAAKAALDRIGLMAAPVPNPLRIISAQTQPVPGSKEWHAGRKVYLKAIAFCLARIASPLLSQREVNTIRNHNRHQGTPWGVGVYDFLKIYEKLKREDEAHG